MASKAMKLKLKGSLREISERRQVGDAEEMLSEGGSANRDAWWKNVGMEEGM
jgi:pyruvate dehydrogenase kinase 2/3/4